MNHTASGPTKLSHPTEITWAISADRWATTAMPVSSVRGAGGPP